MDVSIVVSLFFSETFYCVESFMFFLLFLFTFDPITLMMQSIEVHFIYLFFFALKYLLELLVLLHIITVIANYLHF